MESMLGKALYDAVEVARLIGVSPEQVVRWSTTTSHGPAIVEPTFDPLFAFQGLVSYKVARLIHSRGVSDRDLRHGVETLRKRTGFSEPLAMETVIATLATSGNSFLADLSNGDYEDVGKGGQGVFQEVVRIHLETVSFDESGGPTRWVPVDGVVIDPAIQAGAPCLEGTRIPTVTVVDMLADSDPDDVALDLDLSFEAIQLAEAFEAMLAGGDLLPA